MKILLWLIAVIGMFCGLITKNPEDQALRDIAVIVNCSLLIYWTAVIFFESMDLGTKNTNTKTKP